MAFYKQSNFIGGAWANKSELHAKGVKRAKIVSETNPEPSNYKNEKTGEPQSQDVCKVQFEGEKESLKVSLNRATINGLVNAFGEDSSKWQGNYLSVEIEKLPGKKFPIYLIPEGYERIEDENGYSVIVKIGGKSAEPAPQDEEEGVDVSEIPF